MSRTKAAFLSRALFALLLVSAAASRAAAFAPEDVPQTDQGASLEKGTGGGAPRPAAAPAEPAKAVPWGAKEHAQFFKYQDYLQGLSKRESAQLAYQTPDSWAKLKPEEQAAKIKEAEGTLRARFVTIMAKGFSNDEDKRFVESVWGPDVVAALHNVEVANETGDASQLAAALKTVQALGGKLGAVNIDWNKLFDNLGGAEKPEDAVTADPLAVKKASPFLSALDSPEIKKILSSQKSFDAFVRSHDQRQISPDAYKSLSALYAVFSKAQEPEKSQVAHILPTVVYFIREGKTIEPDPNGPDNALAWASADKYGYPQKVGINPNIRTADPVVVGNILAHEFEHIYDDYTGRFYTLDSELRGFKTNVMFTRTLRKVAPDKYNELLASTDDQSAGMMADEVETEKAYAAAYEGPADKRQPERFAQEIAYGHHYTVMTQGYVGEARLPLRQATDPNFGLPRQLASVTAMRDTARADAAAQEKVVDGLKKQAAATPSHALDVQLEQAVRRLDQLLARRNDYEATVDLYTIQVRRLSREQQWLDQHSKGKDPDAYDLNLAVDKGYVGQ